MGHTKPTTRPGTLREVVLGNHNLKARAIHFAIFGARLAAVFVTVHYGFRALEHFQLIDARDKTVEFFAASITHHLLFEA